MRWYIKRTWFNVKYFFSFKITISNNTISTNTSVVTGVTTGGTGNVITGFTKTNGLVTLGKGYAVTGVTVSDPSVKVYESILGNTNCH